MRYSLTNSEISTITHCLMIASERFEAHVKYLRSPEAAASIGPSAAQRLAETMEFQARDADRLRRRLMAAEAILVDVESLAVLGGAA